MDEKIPMTLEEAQKAIETGEKVKNLYELLMEKTGLTYENKLSEVVKAIRENMVKYYEALEMLSGKVNTGKKLTRKKAGVS